MPKRKKITSTLEPNLNLVGSQSASLLIAPNELTYKDCEWCFQFDDNEPHVFASTTAYYEGKDAKITFTLTNQVNTNITFKDTKTGREFKLFAREKKYEN